MKKITAAIFIAIFLLTACSYTAPTPQKTETSDTASDTTDKTDPRYLAKEQMAPWQIEKIRAEYGESKDNNLLPLSMAEADVYLAQKGLLSEDSEYEDTHWGLTLSTDETPEETLLLDAAHQSIGDWRLMRENMTVLYTEQIQDDYYSILYLTGCEIFQSAQCLVRYRLKNGTPKISAVHTAGQDLTMYGSYIGIPPRNTICFGLIKSTQLNPDTGEREQSDITHFEIITKDKSAHRIEVPQKPYFFIKLLPTDTKIEKLLFYNKDNQITESITEDLELFHYTT